MTFTHTAEGDQCDRCKTPVGPTWRDKAGHLCPRNAPDPFAKTCELDTCGKPLRRKDAEAMNDYRRRRFCDLKCARRAPRKGKAA